MKSCVLQRPYCITDRYPSVARVSPDVLVGFLYRYVVHSSERLFVLLTDYVDHNYLKQRAVLEAEEQAVDEEKTTDREEEVVNDERLVDDKIEL